MLDLTLPNLLNQTSLPFRDARGCKEWLGDLPITDSIRAHAALVEVVDSLNLTELPGFERLKIMELIRDKVAFLQGAVVEVFAGKSLPLSNRALDAWEAAEALWQGMEQGYRYCLRQAANNDIETAKHFGLIVERCLRYTGLQMLHYGLIHRESPEKLIEDCHALFHFAEKRGVAYTNVKDSLDGHRGITTAAQIYVRALLVAAARPCMLLPNELLAVDALLKKWSSKVVISRIPPEDDIGVLRCTDLAGKVGLWAPSTKPVESDTLIFFELKELADSLRRRIRKFGSGVPWTDLNLPSIFSQVSVGHVLTHVSRFWCEPTVRQVPVQAANESCDVAATFEAFYHCLAGKPFEAPRQSEELTGLELQQMAVFGKVTTRPSNEASGPEVDPMEPWRLEGIGEGHLVFRRGVASKIPLSLQQLVAYRRMGVADIAFGVISGLVDHGNDGINVELITFGGRPEPIIVRTKETPFSPAVRMHATDDSERVGLLLSPGNYQHHKVLEVRTEAIQMCRLTGLTQRGPNYELVTYELL